MKSWLLAVLVLLFTSGCATNLATLQTANTLDPGQVRAGLGGGIYLPVGTLRQAATRADTLAADLKGAETSGTVPSVEERREVLTLAASLAVFPPAPVGEVSGRIGIANGFDAGFKWSTSAWRVDGKLRLKGEPKNKGLAISLLVGVEMYTFDVSLWDLGDYLETDISRIFEYVSLENPSRYDLEAQLLFSGNFGGFFLPYGALKYRASLYKLPIVLTVPLDGTTPPETFTQSVTLAGVAHYAGVTVGLGFGPKLFRLYLEVNGGIAMAGHEILGEQVELGGLAVYPAAGLVITLF